jgi:hypothetical protein
MDTKGEEKRAIVEVGSWEAERERARNEWNDAWRLEGT